MKNKTFYKVPTSRGMVLSEILLAAAIISFALASAVIIVAGLQSMTINTQNGFEAQLLAQQEISQAHLVDFNNLLSYQKTIGMYNVDFSVKYRNSFTADIYANVSWYQGNQQKHRVVNDEVVDWKYAYGAEDCDWLDNAKGNLSLNNFGVLNADAGNPITGIATLGDFVYVSADSATSSLPDLYDIDIHDIKNPKIVGHLNTGPGIAAIAAAGNYIFAANAGSFQLQIIDVADPAHPALVSQAKLPGAIISGSSGFGQSVHFFDNKMYIGLTKNAGPEFFIVDVSNPQSPVTLGSYEVGSAVNDIAVQHGKAVIVTPGQTSVLLLDISNPSVIPQIAQSSFSGWQTQGAQSVEMLGSNISVGRTLGGFFSPYPELMSLNRNAMASSTNSLKIGASIEKITAFNDYLYISTNDPSSAFQILHNNTEANASSSPSVSMSSALPSAGVSLTCNSKALYEVTQDDQDFFHIFSLP